MLSYRRSLLFPVVLLLLLPALGFAQVTVDVNFDMKHQVGGKDTFDRDKFIVIHAGPSDGDYADQLDKLGLLIEDYDTYFGRETGRMRFSATRTDEDPNRPGFGLESTLVDITNNLNNNYGNSTARHGFEQGTTITAAQTTPFYPNGFTPVNPQDPTAEQWFFSSNDTANEPYGSATGQFMGQFMKHGYGTGGTTGPPKPTYVEVMNEPVWPLVDVNFYGGGTIDDIFKMHVTVADSVRAYSPESLVGGYCTAFPDFEKPGMTPGNGEMFGQWEERWQRFVDEVGPDMDFYSLHFYDFPSIFNGLEQNRKGANMEATMDMLEHYNTIKYGAVKPLVVSEYGSQLNDFFQDRWSPGRDWYIIKAFNAMMMQFMERPDVIQKTVPFVLAKADFFYEDRGPGLVYPWRMLRRANEPASYTGDWVFTEVIKFYELWANVKGVRVETKATDPDILVDAYVDEPTNKAYLVLHNLDEEELAVDLKTFGLTQTSISAAKIKYLYLDEGNNAPVLEETNLPFLPTAVNLAVEGTMILELSFSDPLRLDEVASEEKIYATDYKQAITANQTINFTLPGVTVGENGEAMLRLGIGRPKTLSRIPTVTINGTPLTVGDDYRGDDQRDRDVFFGLLEVLVPHELLQAGNNVVGVNFPDDGGFVSSVALQKFDFSRQVIRSVAEKRDRSITFLNRETFVPTGETLPQFIDGQSFNAELAYATGVLDSVEEDLNYVAMQIRQVDENFNIVNTSTFQAVVNGDAPNAADIAVDYTLPDVFADGTEIPITAELPSGHRLLLLIFMSVDNDAGFADANTEITLIAKPDRERKIEWINRNGFIPMDSLIPQFVPGQDFSAILNYATGIAEGVEEDLNYVAMQVRQVDADFNPVNTSSFEVVVATEAANTQELAIDYTLPTTFEDGTAIPLSPNLPEGHQHVLLIFMSVDNDAGFANANSAIVIDNLPDRGRMISFANKGDYIPEGESIPEFNYGETFTAVLNYSTGVTDGVEEAIDYIAMHLRQVDENGDAVNISDFAAVVDRTAENVDELSLEYTLPTFFNEGSEIPLSADLPLGHQLVLLIYMSVNNSAGFVDDNTVINLVGPDEGGDRVREISWTNKDDFRPTAEATPSLSPGQTFNMGLSYSTAKTGEAEEDLHYVAMMVREVNENFAIVRTSQFQVVVGGEAPNFDELSFEYTVPTTFDDGTTIPFSENLPDGHQLLLLVFMSVNSDAGFANDNTSILLERSVATNNEELRYRLQLFPTQPAESFGYQLLEN